MAEKMERKAEAETIAKALKLLDPEGILIPGTQEYEDTEAMVTEWFNTYGTAKALEMVRDCMTLMEGSKKPDEGADA